MMSTIQPSGPECAEYAALLPQLGQGVPDLDQSREAAIRAHLDRCIYCRAQFTAYEQLDSALRKYLDRLALAAPSADAMLQAAVAASTATALPIPQDASMQGEARMLNHAPRGEPEAPDPYSTMPTSLSAPRMRPATRARPVLAVVAALLLVALAGALFTALAQTRQDPIGQQTQTQTQPTAIAQPSNIPLAPSATGRSILVSLSQQRLYAYDNGALAFTFTVVTGPQDVQVPTGDTHILSKSVGDAGVNLISPFPPHTHLWYPTVHIHYWLELREGGYSFYDAWWRTSFGPGSAVSSYALDQTTGAPVAAWAIPGGVGMRTADAKQLAGWASIGALVSIHTGA
jgi:hypothetical protein